MNAKAAPVSPRTLRGPIDPGDVCVCTWPDGSVETVEVRQFRADGRADITFNTTHGTEDATVPMSYLTRLPY